jgi:hypothetical protein
MGRARERIFKNKLLAIYPPHPNPLPPGEGLFGDAFVCELVFDPIPDMSANA